MSGASLFSGDEIKNGRYGEAGGEVYDNLKGMEEIRAVIKQSPNRVVDNLVLSQSPSAIKTALIVGPLIFGTGGGPGNTRTMQGPECARYTLKTGHGFRLGEGKSVWSYIHVADVAGLICLLVDAAANSTDGLWNEEGIYLPENGKMVSNAIRGGLTVDNDSSPLVSSPRSLRRRPTGKASSRVQTSVQSYNPRMEIRSCRMQPYYLVPMLSWRSRKQERISNGSPTMEA
jgi:hypothetical protein